MPNSQESFARTPELWKWRLKKAHEHANHMAEVALTSVRVRDEWIVRARDEGELTVTEIGEAIGWDQPATSRAYIRMKERMSSGTGNTSEASDTGS